MKINKTLIILSLLLIFSISLGSVSATDMNVNDTVGSIDCDNVKICSDDSDDLNIKSLNSDSGKKTFQDIRNDVSLANDGDTIKFNGYYSGDGNQIIINKNLTLEGTNNTIFDAKGLSRILVIDTNNITIKNIKFINAYCDGSENNQGAAIYANGVNLTIINSTFINNSAMGVYGEGGAIFLKDAKLYLINSTFINNSAFSGGSIHALNSISHISFSNFSNNYAKYYGGALYTTDVTLIDSSKFSNNYAGYRGGAIHGTCTEYYSAYVKLTNSHLFGNSALNGGVLSISSNYADSQFINCNVFNNNATNGGVISITAKNGVKFINSNLYNNSANKGGICYSIGYGRLIFESSDVFNNSANYGTIIYHIYGNSLVINSSFYDNELLDALFYTGTGDFLIKDSSIIYDDESYDSCVFYKIETGNIYLSNNWWGSSEPDYDKLFDAKKGEIIFNFDSSVYGYLMTNSNLLDDEESNEDNECCSVVLQLDGNNAVITHRRDGGYPLELYITDDEVIRQQKTSIYYFYTIFVNKDGWLAGKGGDDRPFVNEKFEAITLEMILNNCISEDYTNLIIKLIKDVGLGHFILKSPNGTYFSYCYKEGKGRDSSGVLNSGDYVICPNGPDYFVIGHVDNITNPIYTSRYLIGNDAYGVSRHNDMSYYYQNNDDNITVSIYAANDDGHFVNKSDGLPDPIWVNGTYIPSSSIPNLMDGILVASYNYNSAWNQVNTTNCTNQTNSSTVPSSSWEELRLKIANAENGSTIYLDGLTYTAGLDEPIIINKNLIIYGGSKNTDDYAIFDGNNTLSSNFIIGNDVNVTFSNIIFENFAVENDTAIILNNGSLIINSSLFENNTCHDNIIYNSNNLTIINSTFNNNINYGPVIYNKKGCINIEDSIFTNNSVNSYIQATIIQIYSGNVSVNNSKFEANEGEFGGVMQISSGNLDINNSKFLSNIAWNFGGIIYNIGGNLAINNSDFDSNYGRHGGVVYSSGLTNIVYNSNFTSNEAYSHGGCFYNDGSIFNISNCQFENNTAREGSVLYNLNNFAGVYKSTFLNNKNLNLGGDIYNLANLNISESNFSTNTSKEFMYINSMSCSNINNNDFTVKLILNGSVSNNTLNLQFIIDDGYNYLFKSNKTFVIKINNKTYKVNKNNFTLSRLSPGNYTVTVLKIIDEDNNEFLANASYSFIIDKISTVITVDSVKGKVGDKVKFMANVLDEKGNSVQGGTVTFRYANIEFKAKVVDGIATIGFVLPNAPGTYKANAYYEGSNYESSSTTFAVEISDITHKIPVTVTVNPVKAKVGDKVTFTAKVIDENGKLVKAGTVIFEFNGREYTANVVDGFATVDVVLPDKVGNYSATAYFEGDDTYQDADDVFNVEVIAKDIPGPNPNPNPKNNVGNMENTGNPLLVLLIALAAIGLESLRRKF